MHFKSNGNVNVFQTFPKESRLSLISAHDKEAGQYTLAREKLRGHACPSIFLRAALYDRCQIPAEEALALPLSKDKVVICVCKI